MLSEAVAGAMQGVNYRGVLDAREGIMRGTIKVVPGAWVGVLLLGALRPFRRCRGAAVSVRPSLAHASR